MFVIKLIDKILNKIEEFYLMRVFIKFGGNLMASLSGILGGGHVYVSGGSPHE